MATEMKRVMVSIPPDLEQGLDAIKRELFYNKPYSEVYRYVFALGLKAAAEKENRCEKIHHEVGISQTSNGIHNYAKK